MIFTVDIHQPLPNQSFSPWSKHQTDYSFCSYIAESFEHLENQQTRAETSEQTYNT